MMTEKFVCIHGHFYQPPRENPWLEEVESEESAYPYHDWNTRITAECYAPNSVSRVTDSQRRIIGLANNYSKISFNFGPTLLYWLRRHNPDVYKSIIEADKESMKSYSGHGSAMAQVYNHMIMPLANKRDKETQVKWAVRDFENMFKRYPEGMWLPETAVDLETLEVLAEHGIKFTVLSSHQAARIRKIGDKDWIDVSGEKIEPRRSYLCKLPSGKSIDLFFYDEHITSDTAFGNLLDSGEEFAKRLLDAFKDGPDSSAIVSIASDGELYGHHHANGDMTLAYCLHYIASNKLAAITNYAEYLEKHPPEFEVQIQEYTSWSCPHGIERWRSDCGCNASGRGWKQSWRKPLRDAMDWLRDVLASRFEKEGNEYFKDPWQARDDYINVINDRSPESIEQFLSEHAKRPLAPGEKSRAMKLLEMQRHAMLMYTSCGWFFDEISGIEAVQVIRYAARAMQLAQRLFGIDLEEHYKEILKQAPSNIPELENGARIYEIFVKPAVADLAKISAQRTILLLFADDKPQPSPNDLLSNCCFKVENEEFHKLESGRFRIVTSHSKISSQVTLDEEVFGCAAIWLGDHNVSCGVHQGMAGESFKSMQNELFESFGKGQVNETILLITRHFGESSYSLKDMFKDDRSRILKFILQGAEKKATDLYDIIYKDNSKMLQFMKEARIPPPRLFKTAADISLNAKIHQALVSEDLDVELLGKLASEIKSLSAEIDAELIGLEASERLADELAKAASSQDTKGIENVQKLLMVARDLPIKLNLWHSQNVAFEISENLYKQMKQKSGGDSEAWVQVFEAVCQNLGIQLA